MNVELRRPGGGIARALLNGLSLGVLLLILAMVSAPIARISSSTPC